MAEMHTENIKKSGELLSGGKLSELLHIGNYVFCCGVEK